MPQLGTLEELPVDYLEKLKALNTMPLWPSLRSFLPYDVPTRQCQPALWRYADIRPQLMRAGDLTPIEMAERRVLMLCNPGYAPEEARATPSIYLGLQLIKPGETAPNHKHSPSAIRFIVEGDGAYTMVEGEKLPMEPGDLILTPAHLWHEHGHEGNGPVVWLDALDLPLIHWLEASYAIEGDSQAPNDKADASQTHYQRSGLLPYASLDRRPAKYPLRRYPWTEVRAALGELSSETSQGQPVRLAYINPETGSECLPILGFSALMLRPGEELSVPRRSSSAVLHAIEGDGTCLINEQTLSWTRHDTIAVPTHTPFMLANKSTKNPAYIFIVDDAPLQRRLGIFESF